MNQFSQPIDMDELIQAANTIELAAENLHCVLFGYCRCKRSGTGLPKHAC